MCTQADGSVVFQDTACQVIPKKDNGQSKKSAPIPFGLQKTWFDKPPVVPDRATCSEAGCHCGMFSRLFKNSLAQGIADALYMDGSWHRLESTLQALETVSPRSVEERNLRSERDEAACNILMSQTALRMFGQETLAELRKKKRYAEDRGLDDPDRCDMGDMIACDYLDVVTLYKRIQSDIKTLRVNSRITDEEVADNLADN